ncbi:YAP-binding/ALF4/Glomulin [Calycina marina]|uniref:YAP-binding/ALF4/Glomulin n=1 Tax=Calycina marina TaxID=1763456 RepID=A0A9P8CED0_9HELO|nr:YAP-binding/ALF4/Glomulin [Calycina marina]
MASSVDAIAAITDSLPPKTDYLTYLTILESHISPEILPKLNELLQDVELTQNIGWDLIHLLLPVPGAEACLTTISRLGNPREVVLKVTEALQILDLDDQEDEDEEERQEIKPEATEPTGVERFCLLLKLLAIVHPRIKTKYPSRFLSTTLMTVLSTYRPSNQATIAVISFAHTISGKKRPPLPGRKSSLNIPSASNGDARPSAPDPEAEDEEPEEAAIQAKLLQSFVTHILEEYINTNPLEWAARLQEFLEPCKIVTGKKSVGESFKEDPALVSRDEIAGQLVALSRDLGLSGYPLLFEALYKEDPTGAEDDGEDIYPTSPSAIPLSQAGALFIITSLIFSSVVFGSKKPLPSISIFPDHAKLVEHFISASGSTTIGNDPPGIPDAILTIGIHLESTNAFVNTPLPDSTYLQHLQTLSLLSAHSLSPTHRYAAHILTSSLLHAHPTDRTRLTFITDTLESCPFEALKASAVSWLKEEMIIAHERANENAFSSPVALAAAQPYLFPDTSALEEGGDEEVIQELAQSWPFHMAVLNFLVFVTGEGYKHLVPPGMMGVVEEIYLAPLKKAQVQAVEALEGGAETELGRSKEAVGMELELLGERISVCVERIEGGGA